MGYAFRRSLLALALLTLPAGCLTMESRWKAAISTNTVEAYTRFLERYPDGVYATEARARLEAAHFQQAKKANSIAGYQEFTKRYPGSKFNREEEIIWLREGLDADRELPGSLFVMGDGYAVNGKWEDKYVEVLGESHTTRVRTNDILSVYRDRTGHAILDLKSGERHGPISGSFRIRTAEGGLIISPENLALFHSAIATPANQIVLLEIAGKQPIGVMRIGPSRGPDEIIGGTVLPEYYLGKVFSLSNPSYPKEIDGTSPGVTRFSFDFHRHAAGEMETAIVFFWRSAVRENGRFSYFERREVEDTWLPDNIGETRNIKIYVQLVNQGYSFSGAGYLDVFVVPRDKSRQSFLTHAEMKADGYGTSFTKGVMIENTVSNVLRLPVTFTGEEEGADQEQDG